MSHDQCRSTKEFPYAGQNLALESGGSKPLTTLIEDVVGRWWNEVDNASQSDIDQCCNSASGGVIGHFTQVVRDRAIQIGCAAAIFTVSSSQNRLLACNYAYGNMVGTSVYTSGAAASGCTTGTNPSFTSLCNVNEPITAQ